MKRGSKRLRAESAEGPRDGAVNVEKPRGVKETLGRFIWGVDPVTYRRWQERLQVAAASNGEFILDVRNERDEVLEDAARCIIESCSMCSGGFEDTLERLGFSCRYRKELEMVHTGKASRRNPFGHGYRLRPPYKQQADVRLGHGVRVFSSRPVINTTFQCGEPRVHRPSLDEASILVVPRNAALFGSDDYLTNLTVHGRHLARIESHLAAHGNLRGIPTTVQTTIMRVCGRDMDTFGELLDASGNFATEESEALNHFRARVSEEVIVHQSLSSPMTKAALAIRRVGQLAKWRDECAAVEAKIRSMGEDFLSSCTPLEIVLRDGVSTTPKKWTLRDVTSLQCLVSTEAGRVSAAIFEALDRRVVVWLTSPMALFVEACVVMLDALWNVGFSHDFLSETDEEWGLGALLKAVPKTAPIADVVEWMASRPTWIGSLNTAHAVAIYMLISIIDARQKAIIDDSASQQMLEFVGQEGLTFEDVETSLSECEVFFALDTPQLELTPSIRLTMYSNHVEVDTARALDHLKADTS